MLLVEILPLTICLTGIQFSWTVELAYGTPYLLSLGMTNSITALVWLAGPISGLIMQPLIGSISDKANFKWGRRRPFMVMGALIVILSMLCIAFAREIASIFTTVEASASKWAIGIAVFSFYLLDFAINCVQCCARALIVDVAPPEHQNQANTWAGIMIGFGNILGYFMGFVNLPEWFPFLGTTQMKALCMLATAWFSITLFITCMFINEKRFEQDEFEQSRPWFYPLQDFYHALYDLPEPVQNVCNVQFWSWLGWFPFLFYSTSWINSKSGSISSGSLDATRNGSLALLAFSLLSVITMFILPRCRVDEHSLRRSFLFSMNSMWAISSWIFSLLILCSVFSNTASSAIVIVSLCGISWGATQWIPFTMIAEFVSHSMIEKKYKDVQDDDDFDEVSTHSNANTWDAGIILGIHNVYIVLPQFISTFMSSLLFSFMSYLKATHGFADIDEFGLILVAGALSSVVSGFIAVKTQEVDYHKRIK